MTQGHWIPAYSILPARDEGEILLTDGKRQFIGMWHPSLGEAGKGGFGVVSYQRGRKVVTLVEGVTFWQRLPSLPNAVPKPVDWPTSRGTQHGELMVRHALAAADDPNGDTA